MTGYGSRFVAAGYTELKPFIKVDSKPIIEWIVKGMYPGESDFLFICRRDHIETIWGMRKQLTALAPKSEIYVVDNWTKKGPVVDVLRAEKYISDCEPCIINYCDFYMTWDWKKFLLDLIEHDCDGCIPCYTGFHPHLIKRNNLYASCKIDDNENLIEIREKYSFEADKTKTRHSPGVYYFKSGELMKKYCKRLVYSGQTINGEYYASLPYNYLVQDGYTVWVPANVIKFCQWGTPEDLQEYLSWTEMVKGFDKK
jgi:NDP-sugar pyrophosphorylase family protein